MKTFTVGPQPGGEWGGQYRELHETIDGGLYSPRMVGIVRTSDAQLIAASPELLEALREILDLCNGPADSRAELAHHIIASAGTAIAKATEGEVRP
jgi:hypothetical protein